MNQCRELLQKKDSGSNLEPQNTTPYKLTVSVTAWETEAQIKDTLRISLEKWMTVQTPTHVRFNGSIVLLDLDKQVVASYIAEGHDVLVPSLGQSWQGNVFGVNPIDDCFRSQFAACCEIILDSQKKKLSYKIAAIPVILSNGECLGVLGFVGDSELNKQNIDYLLYLYTFGMAWISDSTLKIEEELTSAYTREIKKQEMLILSAKRLHALIDTDSVLMEVVNNIKAVFPKVTMEVFLSQDYQSTNELIKPLDFQGMDNRACTRAFMDGQIVIQRSLTNKSDMYVAVPLSGKQGVYGVLYLECEDSVLEDSDIQFISMLADFGGASLENAKLYEQSYMLINELRLINEITQRLNQSLSLNEIFSFVSSELVEIFGAEYFCILQKDKEGDQLTVQASNLPEMFQENFTVNNGFSGVMFATKEPVIISDYWVNPKVKSKLMELTKSRSLIASPIIVKEEVMGVILVVHQKPNFFSYDNYKLLQMLSGHIGLAMTNASLHSEVKRMVITDNLTGLNVRHVLDEQINVSQKKDFCGSFILIDIDNFKNVNDTYGHQVGDQILVQVSAIIKNSIRDHDVAARWGGEELAVYFPQINKEQSLRIADRIRMKVMKETHPFVTISCGVSDWNWEDNNISVESLFYKADMALYIAKNSGKNQIIVDSASH